MIKIGRDESICLDNTIIDAEYTIIPNENIATPTPLTLFHMVTPSP
jgi:hypothetical protein